MIACFYNCPQKTPSELDLFIVLLPFNDSIVHIVLTILLLGISAVMNKTIAVIICMTIPTNGIHAIHDVTIPRMLPPVAPPSLLVTRSVIMCKINITNNGVHPWLMIKMPPINGIPKKASAPPVIHFSIFDGDILFSPSCAYDLSVRGCSKSHQIISGASLRWLDFPKIYTCVCKHIRGR